MLSEFQRQQQQPQQQLRPVMFLVVFISRCEAGTCGNREEDLLAPSEEAIQRSKDLTCNVCFEVDLGKDDPELRFFGILSQCDYCFCFSCIGRWRKDHDTCPFCRRSSEKMVKSSVYVDSRHSSSEKVDLFAKHQSCSPTNQSPTLQPQQGSSTGPRVDETPGFRVPLPIPATQMARMDRREARRQRRMNPLEREAALRFFQ